MNINNLGEVSVGYKYTSTLADRPKITNVHAAFEVLSKVIDLDSIGLQEQFVVLFLNNSNVVIGSCNAFKGGLTSTLVDVRIIVATALKLMSASIIVAHNHPSGNLNPSASDIALTQKLKIALEYMDIKLLDHLIISPELSYKSFSDEGLL